MGSAVSVINYLRRAWLFSLAVIIALFFLGFKLDTAHAQNVTINSPRNCDSNAVIYCGAGSVNGLINKYDNGDGRNSVASIHNIYSCQGISGAMVNSMSSSSVDVRVGTVTKSGKVLVGGQVVATGAITGGRDNIAGSTREDCNGTTFYSRPPSVSFASSELSAFVVMQNGRFSYAVLASCGNVVRATPTAPKPTPAPTPTPTVTTTTTTTAPTPKPTVNVCSGNTANSNSNIAAQGGNCSTNTTTVNGTMAPPSSTTSTSVSTPTNTSATATTSTPVPSAPANLVNTGPGDIAGVFGAVTIASAAGFNYYLRRRQIT